MFVVFTLLHSLWIKILRRTDRFLPLTKSRRHYAQENLSASSNQANQEIASACQVRKERTLIRAATIPAFSILLLIYIGIFLMQSFFPQLWLNHIMAGCALLACLASLKQVRRPTLLLSTLLTGSGFLLMLQGNPQPLDWSRAAIHNASLICLVLTVPLLGSILAFEPYARYLTLITERYITSPFRLYSAAALLTSALSSLLNLASMHFVHHLLQPRAAKCPPALFSQALFRGFMPNVMWSPSYISVAIAIQYSGISWFSLAPVGISLALTGVVWALLLGWFEYGKLAAFSTGEVSEKDRLRRPSDIDRTAAVRGVWTLLSMILLLISLIVFLEYYTHKSALVLVPLISFTGPMLLSRIYGKSAVYSTQFRQYVAEKLPRAHNEMLLFSSIGFFGYALAGSSFPAQIPLLVSRFGLDTPLKIALLIVGIIIMFAAIGIHPMITIAAISSAMPPGSTALSGQQLAGTFLVGYMFYGICSPFSATNLIMASLTAQNPIVAGLRQNGLFALFYVLLALCLLLLLFAAG